MRVLPSLPARRLVLGLCAVSVSVGVGARCGALRFAPRFWLRCRARAGGERKLAVPRGLGSGRGLSVWLQDADTGGWEGSLWFAVGL